MKKVFFPLMILLVGLLAFPGLAGAASPFDEEVTIGNDQSTGGADEVQVPSQPGAPAGVSQVDDSETGALPATPGRKPASRLFRDPFLGIAQFGITGSTQPEVLPRVSPRKQTRRPARARPANCCPLPPTTKVTTKTTTTKKAAPASSGKRLEIKIPEFIRKILSWFGVKLPKNGKIIIVIGGGSTSPKPPKPPQPPTTKPPSTGPLPGTISGLKNYMKQHFGITAADGNGASWSQRQLEEANKVLATLPSSFISNTKTIARDAIFQSKSVLGYVRMGIPTVHLLNSSTVQGTFQGTLVHEMTHCFQANHPQIQQLWEKSFWPWGKLFGARPGSVSSYGNSSPLEDMAESVRTYWQSGPKMKAQQPQRYEFIRKYVMSGREF